MCSVLLETLLVVPVSLLMAASHGAHTRPFAVLNAEKLLEIQLG